MNLHYLEIITHEVAAVCHSYQSAHDVCFSGPEEALGGAYVAKLSDSVIGVRAPLHDDEDPIIRSYFLVKDITLALDKVEKAGAEIALPPMVIPGRGQCAIYLLGGVEHGLWQL